MKRIRYTLTSLSPLLLSTGSEDANATSSLDYIPGRVMQGILAYHWIEQSQLNHAHKDADFYRCILNGDLTFTPAYLQDRSQRTYPLPFSIQKEKEGDHVQDVLVKEAALGTVTKPVGRLGYIKGDQITTCQPGLSLHFHHNSQDGQSDPLPFTYEALEAGQTFEGFIIGEDDVLVHVHRYLQSQQSVYVGRSRSAQYGKAALHLSTSEVFANDTDTELPDFKDEVYLSCLSDVLIYDVYGNPSTQVHDLQRYLGEGVTITEAMMRVSLYQSYQGNWNLKRPDEMCIEAGSTFILQLSSAASEAVLTRLMQTGLGEKTHEGLGRVVFGLQGNDEYTLRPSTKKDKRLVPSKCPELAQTLLERVLLKKVDRACFEMAVKQANVLRTPRLPKSLLSRLDSYLQVHSVEQFQDFVLDLRGKPAGDKLEGLKFIKYQSSGPNSLFELLVKHPDLERLSQGQPYEAFAQKLGVDLQPWIQQHHEKLLKRYYQSLMQQLKDIIKRNEKTKTQEAQHV